MKINILDTHKLYMEMMKLSENRRYDYFDENFLKPFAPVFERTRMPRNPEALSCLSLTGKDKIAENMLVQLVDKNVWHEAHKAIELAVYTLKDTGIKLPEEITLGIFLGDPDKLSQSEGYTGVGSVPGYIQIIIAPNSQNLQKINACIAHEFHHNVLFNNVKWDFMNVTLSQYLAVEGLAESFASFLYGDVFIGPWVTGVSGADLERTREIIEKNLDVSGFMEVRKYIFGDHPMIPESDVLGIPFCGGYATGYHAVQALLLKTHKSIVEATKDFVDGVDVVKQSGYFNI
ncbi:DUF2268 domain-containing putative Zn-dependent protease [Fusibacter bizertensis]|uniref:DUF2268 domain-containing putative Zn-dependent protease n=1 Tax=Fusibacter bizertensis TaxID=1488331 RepID=A0ABT6NG16_9FIRM|nr:DUF2268 domain-containing putative Zn-dependent protease [Fusibacter bizertensis]MDH8679372.1 DUF2268 domain-containing putative Zn-dependent protease [Fusibacter bizertensis]